MLHNITNFWFVGMVILLSAYIWLFVGLPPIAQRVLAIVDFREHFKIEPEITCCFNYQKIFTDTEKFE